ncbi:hypothetical protein AB1Y20_014604 [Prymnesium parvum]|uniref:Peptidylamidoglycolate lyase n=1 Tax=Prymnesium parvum TaxID=97485 RepID=A0AB34IEU2_PRYPA
MAMRRVFTDECNYAGEARLAHLRSFGTYGLDEGQFSMPCNLLSLPDGDVVVADGGGCRLQILSPRGELRRVIGCRGDEPGQFNYPAGLALDGAALLVCDRGNCRLQRIRLSDGSPLASTKQLSASEPERSKGEKVPRKPSSSRLAALELQSATPDGWTPFMREDTEEQELLNYPWGIALAAGWLLASDKRGHIFVFDKNSLDLLRVYDPSAVSGAPASDALNSPHAMVASASELFIADHNNHRLVVFSLPTAEHADFKPSPARVIGSYGDGLGQFNHPTGLAICNAILYVSEFTGRRVQALTLAGEPLRFFRTVECTRFLGLCADSYRVCVGDFDLDCVHVLSTVGSLPFLEEGLADGADEDETQRQRTLGGPTGASAVSDPLDAWVAGGSFAKNLSRKEK